MTYGRPLEYDPDKVLDAAMQVFWSKGYEATSLQDLLTAMELSKSSLYQGFGGKKDLFIRCIDRYREQVTATLRGLLDKAESGLSFIERLLLNAAAEARQPDHLRRGCLLMNTATEFAQTDPRVAENVATGFDGLRTILMKAVRRGQQEGKIAQDQDAEVLAAYLLSSLGGLKTIVKGGADEQRTKEVVGVILRALG